MGAVWIRRFISFLASPLSEIFSGQRWAGWTPPSKTQTSKIIKPRPTYPSEGHRCSFTPASSRRLRFLRRSVIIHYQRAPPSSRCADSTGVTDRVVNQLLCELDGVSDRSAGASPPTF